MNRAAFVVPLVLVVTILGAIGQSLLKHAINRIPGGTTAVSAAGALLGNPFFYAGGCVLGVAFLTWMYALSKADLSYAVPFLSFGFITGMIASVLFLHEHV